MPRIVKEPEERKSELLNIGIRLFLHGGSKNVSIQKVVKEANVATGLFYYYFKTKEAFIDEAIRVYIDAYVCTVKTVLANKETPVLERLTLFLEQFYNRLSAIQHVANDPVLHCPEHFMLEIQVINQLHETITDFITEGCAQQVFETAQPHMAAYYVIYGLAGLLHQSISETETTTEEIRQLVMNTLSRRI